MNSSAPAAAALILAIVGRTSAAAEVADVEAPVAPPQAAMTTPRFNAVRAPVPPVLDGRLDEAVWSLSIGGSPFTQQIPYGGAPPSEPTTVKVLYDAEAVYIGFECTQTKTPIVGHLTRRDEDSESDWVWVSIDSRNDSRSATYFAVNVAGVLVDGIMHDGNTFGVEWDENWEARTAVTSTGWSAEIRIPLRVLRFSPHLPVQSWGFWASRFVGLLQEKDDWPYISREVAAPIPFFGRVDDLRDLPRGGIVELKPFGLGQVRYRGADPSVVAKGLDAGGSAGLDLKLHVTQSLTLDTAVNPDFAQVEADQLVLNLNNYEIFYPEKRPLFLEGTDVFTTPLGLFYSRRIGSSPATPTLKSGTDAGKLVDVPGAATIYAATKLTGRVGDAWTVGALSALAARNDYAVLAAGVRTQRTAEPLTSFNVLRIKRDIGERAQLGVIFTGTERFEQTSGDQVCPATGLAPVSSEGCFRNAGVAGIDGVWRSAGADYVAAGQFVGSVVKGGEPEVQADGTSIASGDSGVGGWFRLAKEGGRHFLTELIYTGIGRRMTYNDLGFMQRQNLHEVKAGWELRSLDPGALTLERHLRLDLSVRRSLDGLDLGTTVELGFTTRLQGFWNAHAAIDLAPSYFDDREVGDGSALERAAYAGGKLEISSDPTRRWGAGVKGELRVLGAGAVVDVRAPLAWRPLSQFRIELEPQVSYHSGEQRFVSNSALNTAPALGTDPYVFGRQLARNAGAIVRVQYTFTPRLSLQTFAQLFLAAGHFDDFREGPSPRLPGSRIALADLRPLGPLTAAPQDADFEQAALNANVVLRWEYRLGSTLFVVYSRSQVPDVTLGVGETAGLRASAIGRVPAVDTVLVKLSFWWAS